MTAFLTAVRIVIFSSAIIYGINMLKGAQLVLSFTSSSSDFMRKPVSVCKGLLSSPLQICIFMNFIVLLIKVSSRFHHPQMGKNHDHDEEGGAENNHLHEEDYDGLYSSTLLPPSLSPPPEAPPPLPKHQEKSPKERKAVTKTPIAKNSDGGKTKSSASTTLKKQNDTASEVHKRAVFSDLSRLAKAKDIKKEQTAAMAEGKIRATEQLKRGTNVTKVNKRSSFQAAAFADLPKLAEAKEIRKAHSLESANQNKTLHNQAKKQLENEDHGDAEDTMEATWRAINGATKPQEKQLKKSETWPQQHKFVLPDETEEGLAMPSSPSPSSSSVPSSPLVKEMRKSMTFNDAATIRCKGGLIRRDPSVNLEEFNQRVEAFIQNFNNEMRLQRQESDQRYLDMIKRGL